MKNSISSEELQSYYKSGYHLQNGLLDSNQQGQVYKLIQDLDSSSRKGLLTQKNSFLMPHRSFPWLVDILKNSQLPEVAAQILQGEVDLLHSQVFLNPPGTKGFLPHQDNYFNQAQPEDALLAVWIPLEPVDRENGTLFLYPGSHSKGVVQVKKRYSYLLKVIGQTVIDRLNSMRSKNKADLSSGVLDQYIEIDQLPKNEAFALNLQPGDACFMHGNLFHGSFDNKSQQRNRPVLLVNLLKRGAGFKAGAFSKRQPVPLS